MKFRDWRFTASSSLLLACALVAGATRPHYGGTLRIQLLSPISRLDGSDAERLLAIIGDTLLTSDDEGGSKGQLATEWQHDPSFKRWHFRLRPRVLFHDGSALTAGDAAESLKTSLRLVYPASTVSNSGDTINIESLQPMPFLGADVAQPRHAIVKHVGDTQLIGTGPFRVSSYEAGNRITCAAFEDYWGGRPFLDSVEIGGPQSNRGLADVIELAVNVPSRQVPEHARLWTSAMSDLIAFVVPGNAPLLRDALAYSHDRAPIASVLTQRRGQPAYSLLPEWLSGYAFVFESKLDRDRAKQAAAAIANSVVVIGYSSGDSLARLVAERLVLNARDIGLRARVGAPEEAMIRVVRVEVPSNDTRVALRDVARQLGLQDSADGAATPQGLYEAERALLETGQVVPIVFVPTLYAIGPRIRNWDAAQPQRSTWWRLENVWLSQ
jgi:peptide/nickel transport system substrate-binding protein